MHTIKALVLVLLTGDFSVKAAEPPKLRYCGVFQNGAFGFGVQTPEGKFFEILDHDSEPAVKNQIRLFKELLETNPQSGCVVGTKGQSMDSASINPTAIEVFAGFKSVEYVKIKLCGNLTKKPYETYSYEVNMQAGAFKYSVAYSAAGPEVQKEFNKLPMGFAALGCISGVFKKDIPNTFYPRKDDPKTPVIELMK